MLQCEHKQYEAILEVKAESKKEGDIKLRISLYGRIENTQVLIQDSIIPVPHIGDLIPTKIILHEIIPIKDGFDILFQLNQTTIMKGGFTRLHSICHPKTIDKTTDILNYRFHIPTLSCSFQKNEDSRLHDKTMVSIYGKISKRDEHWPLVYLHIPKELKEQKNNVVRHVSELDARIATVAEKTLFSPPLLQIIKSYLQPEEDDPISIKVKALQQQASKLTENKSSETKQNESKQLKVKKDSLLAFKWAKKYCTGLSTADIAKHIKKLHSIKKGFFKPQTSVSKLLDQAVLLEKKVTSSETKNKLNN